MSEYAWIVGVDPGKTCGHALLLTHDPLGTLMAGQHPPMELVDRVHLHLGAVPGPGLIAVERFTVTARTAQLSPQLDAVEVIGCLRWLAYRYGVDLLLQTPAAAKRFASDVHLRIWGVYDTRNDHANDATRHALLAAMTAGYRDWLPT